MKHLFLSIALFAIIFLSSCAPARVGVGVGVRPQPYHGSSYYKARPYYNQYYYGHSRSYGRPRYGGHYGWHH